MKFLADECFDAGLVAFLREAGHDVQYVLETQRGDKDDLILRCAYNDGRILLTEDKDFGEPVYRLKLPAIGIVLLRIKVEDRKLKWPRIKKLIDGFSDRIEGHFVIVDANKLRFRKLL